MFGWLVFSIVFTAISTVLTYEIVGRVPGSHYTDFTPDYPGGVLGLAWLVANAVVWSVSVAGLCV